MATASHRAGKTKAEISALNRTGLIVAAYVAKLVAGGFLLAVFETSIAKMRVFRVPEFLGVALMLALLATHWSPLLLMTLHEDLAQAEGVGGADGIRLPEFLLQAGVARKLVFSQFLYNIRRFRVCSHLDRILRFNDRQSAPVKLRLERVELLGAHQAAGQAALCLLEQPVPLLIGEIGRAHV